MSENSTATDARWGVSTVLNCLKKSMGLAYYTKLDFDSLADDQTHVLTEKECDSENKAFEEVNKVGGEDFKLKKISTMKRPVIILNKRENQMHSEVAVKVESDISKRKYAISWDEWSKQKMDNHYNKPVEKVNLKKVKIDIPVVAVSLEVLGSEGDNKGATDFSPELQYLCNSPSDTFPFTRPPKIPTQL